MTRVCIIGAGPAGLVATKTLAEAGLDVDCLELSTVIGGHWAYDNPNGRSAVYRSIHTNTTPEMSRLSDFEMPSDGPDFPTHAEVLEWWHRYVDHFGFRDRIQLGAEVLTTHALEPTGWRIRIRQAGGDAVREERYDALLACSGNNWCPRVPEVPGEFAGTVFHAQTYRDAQTPVDLRGQRVLVVGIGNTGCELACEIAETGARSVLLSARSGAWILPKTKDGRPAFEGIPMMHPCDPVPRVLAMLPARLREGLFSRLGRLVFQRSFGERMRHLESLGLPPPPADPMAKRATVCDPLPDALEAGSIQARPALAGYDGKEVRFSDGRVDEVDVVIHATGFHLRYPYLPREWADPQDDDLRLFMGTMHPARPDLFVIGVSRPTGAFWPIAEVHAQFAAALLSGRYAPPGQREIARRTRSILGGPSFNPALYGLAMREELKRGAVRAARAASTNRA